MRGRTMKGRAARSLPSSGTAAPPSVYALKAAFGGCAPTCACERSPSGKALEKEANHAYKNDGLSGPGPCPAGAFFDGGGRWPRAVHGRAVVPGHHGAGPAGKPAGPRDTALPGSACRAPMPTTPRGCWICRPGRQRRAPQAAGRCWATQGARSCAPSRAVWSAPTRAARRSTPCVYKRNTHKFIRRKLHEN